MNRAVAAAALAVCAAATAGLPAHAGASVRHFSRPLHVDPSVSQRTGEPSIAVARDGTEYIVAPDGAGARTPGPGATGAGGSLIWRSVDQGHSWAFLGSYDVPTGGGDTDVAVAPDGTVFASGLSYAACSTVAVSRDKGQTWVADPLAGCASMPVRNDRQWTAVDGNTTVYTSIGDSLDGDIDVVRSSMTSPFVAPSTAMHLYTGGDYEWPGTIAVDQRTGTAYDVWNTTGAPDDCDGTGPVTCAPTAASTTVPDRIYVSVLPRGTTTPPAPTVVATRRYDTFDSFVSDAVDAAGNVYVVWSERHPQSAQTWIMLARSADGGRTWSPPTRVGSAATAVYPWVTAGDRGRVAVSYYGTAAHGVSAQLVPTSATWSVHSEFSTDSGRTWADYRTTGVVQTGPICTSGTRCARGTRNLLDFFETAADPQGCLVTAYADNSSGAAAAYVSYVRQISGPGLRASRSCGR